MGEVIQQRPVDRLSDSQVGGREGCGDQGVALIPFECKLTSQVTDSGSRKLVS